MLNLTDLLRVPHVDSLFDISSHNKIAFAWNKTGEWQIYETRLPSPSGRRAGDEDEITAITHTTGGKFNPRYSPDGTKLAYALDIDGSESYHLIIYDFESKQHTDLTPNISHALQPNFCWSPNGQHLALLSNEHGHFSAHIISVNGGTPKLILDTGHPAWQVEWSPDGKHLAVCCEMHGQDYGIFIVNLETKKVTPLCHRERQRRVSTTASEILRSAQNDILNAFAPQWTPDGKGLLFHSDANGWFNIGLYDVDSKEITWQTNSEGDSQTPTIVSSTMNNSHLKHQIAYAQSRDALNWVEIKSVGQAFSLTTNGGLATRPTADAKKYQVGKGIHSGIKFTSDSKRMVTTFSSPSQPSDLWMINVESGEAIQLTNSMPENLSREEFVTPEEIFYEGMDGVNIPALLFHPEKLPAPAVVMIHGGPNWQYAMEWNPVMAYFASRGYVVLAPNYRGSTGYGREWQYAARFDMGGVDTRDVAAGAHYLIRAGLALKNRIAVTGGSHGGYLTMTCLTQFPELWRAGSAVVPFMNWFKSHDDSREDLQHWNIENMGDPKENYKRWYNASPYFFLDKINAPVQLICGGNDPRCPASDSLEARDKLVSLGKEVELLLYEDEGHEFLKIENVLDAEMRRVEFIVMNVDR
ncbi:MAG TPA: S9 family peptidase [Anaerolineales bacterium]|jgi:dipeptidyl aminopeptidase/acylaminoacyl peptidase|nr:S9 family peptidase [Anaerolineales bacterium]